MRSRPIGEVLARPARARGRRRRRRPRRAAVHGPRHRRGPRRHASWSTPPASSQFISALLLAGARYDEGVDVRHDGKPVPSLPHIDMTVAMLREHGVEVDDADAEPLGGRARAGPRRRPPDRAGPVQRRAVPGAGRGLRRLGDRPRLAARSTTQAGDALREILAADGLHGRAASTTGLRVTGTGTPRGHRRRPARRRRAGPGGRRPVRAGRRRPRTCAASRTSAATRPTGWPRWPPSSAGSAPTSPSTPTG